MSSHQRAYQGHPGNVGSHQAHRDALQQSEAYRYSSAGARAATAPTYSFWDRFGTLDAIVLTAATLVGLILVVQIWNEEHCARSRAISEPPLGSHGESVDIDGIRVMGSPEFVSRTVQAIQCAWGKPSYRYIRYIRSIEEREMSRSTAAFTYVGTGRVYVNPNAALHGCGRYAGYLVHEGAHNAEPNSGHDRIYAIHAQALRELGESRYAAQADRMSSGGGLLSWITW